MVTNDDCDLYAYCLSLHTCELSLIATQSAIAIAIIVIATVSITYLYKIPVGC